MDKAQIKETIVNAIKTVQEKGYILIRGCFYDETPEGKFVCALGSVLVANNRKTYDVSPQIQEIFGVDYIWVNDFIQCYDGNEAGRWAQYKEAKEVAEEIIKEFNPEQHWRAISALSKPIEVKPTEESIEIVKEEIKVEEGPKEEIKVEEAVKEEVK